MVLENEIVLRAGVMNRNNRYYSQDIVNKMCLQLKERAGTHLLFGEFSRTGFMPEQYDVDLRNVSHKIINPKVEGTDLKADIQILETPAGRILKDLLTSTPKSFVFRPRMMGHVGPAGNVVECHVTAIDAIAAPNDSFLGII